MMEQFQRIRIGDHIHFSSITDGKFKHNRLSVSFVLPLEADTASHNAVVPFVLRKGCRECPDFTSLNARLCELYGAVLDADVTKYGAYQILSVAIQGLDNRYTLEKEDIVGQCASLLASVVLDPKLDENGLFDKEDVALERQYITDTIQAEINDKRTYAIGRCQQEMCKGEPVALRRYGELETARAITPETAVEAYRRMLKTAPVEILFSGPGDPGEARRVFEERFGNTPRNAFDYALPGLRSVAREVTEIREELDINQGKLVMGLRTGSVSSLEEINAMRMFSALFGGTPFSKLFLNVREKLGLCYYCTSRFDVSTKLLLVDSGVEAANKQQAQEEILAQLKKVQEGDFTEEELANTKLLMKNSITTTNDSLSSLEGWYLTQILRSQNISPAQDAENIDKVTREQVIRAAGGITLDTVYFLTGKQVEREEQ